MHRLIISPTEYVTPTLAIHLALAIIKKTHILEWSDNSGESSSDVLKMVGKTEGSLANKTSADSKIGSLLGESTDNLTELALGSGKEVLSVLDDL